MVECDKCGIAVHEGMYVCMYVCTVPVLLLPLHGTTEMCDIQVAMASLMKKTTSVTTVLNYPPSQLFLGFVMLAKLVSVRPTA